MVAVLNAWYNNTNTNSYRNVFKMMTLFCFIFF